MSTFAALVATGKYLKGTTLEARFLETMKAGRPDQNQEYLSRMTAGGLPIAIEILGRPFSESRLIELAHAYEQASRARVAPRTTPALSGNVFVF